MTILARLPDGLQVEVTGAYTTGNRTRAAIRALSGEPFTVYTHGGPAMSDSCMVDAALLSDVHQTNEYGSIRRSRRAGVSLPELAYVPADDELPAAVFPVRTRRQPWKGANSD